MKQITIDLHPVSATVTTLLAIVAGRACDYAIAHPAEVAAAAHRLGAGPLVTGVVAAVVIPGLLPKAAAWCHAKAGDAPPAPPASDGDGEAPAFQPGVRVPVVDPPNTNAAEARAATAALPADQQTI